MNSITIVTIVVVVLLALVIGALCWLAFYFCLRTYKLEIRQGIHDDDIKKEFSSKKKSKWGLLGLIASWVVLAALMSLFVTGIVYKTSGQVFSAGNDVALVIKSGSMSDFYNNEVAEKNNNDKSLQFGVGDICFFNKISKDSELTIGDVYGYKRNGIIITHRLVSINGDYYQFRGDNNSAFDGTVTRDNIVYHYTGNKLVGIGSFVLFAQSYLGIMSLVGIIGILILSEVVYSKIDTLNKIRAKELGYCIDPKEIAKVEDCAASNVGKEENDEKKKLNPHTSN